MMSERVTHVNQIFYTSEMISSDGTVADSGFLAL